MARLDHLNLTVESFSKSVDWYRDMFGFEVVETGTGEGARPWGILRSGDSMLCISEDGERALLSDEHPQARKLHRVNHFGLRISDRSRWEALISERGIPTYFDSPVQYPHSTSWYVKDPTGHLIEVVQWNEDRVSFD